MLLVRQRLSRTLSHAGPMLRFVTQCRWKYAVSFRRLLLSVESESSSPWMSMTVSGIAAAYLCATSRCQCCRSRCCSNSLKQYPITLNAYVCSCSTPSFSSPSFSSPANSSPANSAIPTSTYTPNFMEIENTFFERADVHARTDGHLRPTLLGRLRRVGLKVKDTRR